MKQLLSRFRFRRLAKISLVLLISGFGIHALTQGLDGSPIIGSAFAQASQQGNILDQTLGTLGNVVATLSTLLVKLVSLLIFVALYWMGDLMDNTFILEGEMGLKLQTVWVIIRNFVNIFFALALVVVAAMSVVGYGDDSGNYTLKKFIPKMALALIAVNFTFLACRIVLDVNNVLTTAIFSIPQSITTTSDIYVSSRSPKIFRNMRCFNPNETVAQARTRVQQIEADPRFEGVITNLAGVCFVQGTAQTLDPATDVVALDSSRFNRKDFTWAMATQFNGLHELNRVTQQTSGSFTDLSINAIFSLVLAVVYGTAYIAMFIILIGRMAVLWMTIILSPLAVISIVIPEFLPEQLNVTKRFLDNAFIPLKMAIPLSFGYILISQMSLTIDTGSAIATDKVIDLSEGGELARNVTMQTIIYGAASVAVIWMGVFMAVTENVVGSGLVNSFKGTMENIGKTVARWPTYLPFVPVPGGVASFQGLKYGLSEARTQVAEVVQRRDQQTLDRTLQSLGFAPAQIRTAINNIERMVDQGGINNNELNRELRTLFSHDRQNNTTYFQSQTRDLTNIDDPTQQAEIARAFGFTGNAEGWNRFTQAVRDNQFEALQRGIGAGGGADRREPEANYGTIAMGTLSGRTSVDFGADITDELRSALNIEAGQSTFDPNRVDFTQFMNAVKDREKVNRTQLQQMLNADFFKNLAENQPVREQWQRDQAFLNRLLQMRTDGNTEEERDLNKQIRDTYLEIMKDSSGNVDEESQMENLRIDEDGYFLNEEGQRIANQ